MHTYQKAKVITGARSRQRCVGNYEIIFSSSVESGTAGGIFSDSSVVRFEVDFARVLHVDCDAINRRSATTNRGRAARMTDIQKTHKTGWSTAVIAQQ